MVKRYNVFPVNQKNIESKVSLPDKSEKYVKTIVAFANTQGGKLIVGVDDKTIRLLVWKMIYYFRPWMR